MLTGVAATKELIKKSDEKQFQIGLEFPDMYVLRELLDIVGVIIGE